MANVTVIGVQWGDEGKGKIVDWLASRADVVARFQGGHNAGHTLVVGDQTYKLSLLPSGIVRGTLSVIGNGVVLDPWALKAEVERLGEQGVAVTPETLHISDTCPLILPFHRDLDALREDASGQGKIGTTRRGIGPAYEDKVGRRAIRVCDLAHLGHLGPQIDRLCAHHDALRAGFGEPPIDRARLERRPRRDRRVRASLRPADLDHAQRGQGARQAHPVRRRPGRAARRRPRHLSVRHLVQHRRRHRRGGQRPRAGRGRLRARHRQGLYHPGRRRPLPHRARGRDRPAPRRAGPRVRNGDRPQAPLRLVRRRAGPPGLRGGGSDRSGADQARRPRRVRGDRICTGYRLRGRALDHLPAHAADQEAVEPVYETIAGWAESTAGARSWAELPAQAIKYIRRIEELCRISVALVSTSPEREDTILVRDPFAD